MPLFHAKSLHCSARGSANKWNMFVCTAIYLSSTLTSAKGLEILSEKVEEISNANRANLEKAPASVGSSTLNLNAETNSEQVKVETIKEPKIEQNTGEISAPLATKKISEKDAASDVKERKLEKSYEAGFNLGFQTAKFSAAKLDTTTGANVFVSKSVPLLKNSFKSKVIIGYLPLTGSLRVNERDHDVVSHGITAGLLADYSLQKSSVDLRLSGQLGYFLTYSKADDGLEPESDSKLNAATFIVNSSALWGLTSGTKVGPQITLAGGQVSWISLGMSSSIEF